MATATLQVLRGPATRSCQYTCVAHLHKRKKPRHVLTSHSSWKYPEPATRNDLWRIREAEDKSLTWAKPLLAYRERKLQKEREQEGKPPAEPHMIHMVKLIADPAHRPWWEREILDEYGLEKVTDCVPVKNTPSANIKLREIKHLVQIKPLTFPHGMPEHPSDFNNCELRPDGRLLVKKHIRPPFQDPATPDTAQEDKFEMSTVTVKKDMQRQRENYILHAEHFQANYEYKNNQDGKEYRYKKFGYGKIND